MKGKFAAFEGLDGSGTTTQASLLVKYLFEIDKKNDVLLTRNPTKHSPYGKELRRRLSGDLLPGEEVIHDQNYWADLFINDRKWHHDNFVVPAINKGQQVVCDRYKISTIAYQSMALDMDDLIKRHEGLMVPDITFLLDLTAEQCMWRMGAMRAGKKDYFEHLEIQEKVMRNYHKAAEKLKEEPIVIIDGSKSIDEVAKDIQAEINNLYGYEKAA